VYLADEHEVGSVELFRRELTGGGPVPLIADPPLHPWSASGLELTADGKTVLFNADLLSDDVCELLRDALGRTLGAR
jgi:hypothetical protein